MVLTIHRKLFFSHFLAVVLVSGSIGTLFYREAMQRLHESLRSRLEQSAALLTPVLAPADLESIDASEDAATPMYRDYLERLRAFQSSNRDIAFIYILRRSGDTVSFVVDSDNGPAQALPGRVYSDPPPAMLAGFSRVSADEAIMRDEWGWFLSGYAPLHGGDGRYLVGIDMRADEVARKTERLRLAGLTSLALSLTLAWVLSRYLASRITRPIRALSQRAREVQAGRLDGAVAVATGDEVEELGRAFNEMTGGLAAARAEERRALAELEASRATLELRVTERTAELAEANRELHAEIAERRKAQEALERAATTDPLTELLNRRAALRLVEQERERIRRTTAPFSLALADLDRFKSVNDRYGHEVGDRALTEVAHRLTEAVRGQDAVARWGGEEFLVFLPETPLAGAAVAAEKLRAALAEPLDLLGHRIPLSVSIGVAEARVGESLESCLRRADTALYRAKDGGRNRVELDESAAPEAI